MMNIIIINSEMDQYPAKRYEYGVIHEMPWPYGANTARCPHSHSVHAKPPPY